MVQVARSIDKYGLAEIDLQRNTGYIEAARLGLRILLPKVVPLQHKSLVDLELSTNCVAKPMETVESPIVEGFDVSVWCNCAFARLEGTLDFQTIAIARRVHSVEEAEIIAISVG